ncbi:MAG: glycosyltransferase [Albidovulum sp.]|uniref:glycosyltransferase n=1 Tax=Albidovulum sp. TaxID=1872424 RepID=UPI003CA60F2A
MNQNALTFVATGKSGLGHLRRVTTIAQALRRKRRALGLRLLTNAVPTGIADGDLRVFDAITMRPRQEMAEALADSTGITIFDTVQVPGIERLGGRKALILRETMADRVAHFSIPGGWNRVIVPNPRDHWMPGGRALSASVQAVGWIVRPTGPRDGSEPPAGIVVATGGGGTDATRDQLYPLLDRVIADTRRRVGRAFQVRQALGPRAGGQRLAGVDKVFDPGGDLNRIFRAADLVITTAGYNSVLELATTDTPALLMPIPRSLDDQVARVRCWGSRLGHGYDLLQHEQAVDWLAAQIETPRRRAPVDLGSDGASRAADLILDLL